MLKLYYYLKNNCLVFVLTPTASVCIQVEDLQFVRGQL